MDESTKRYLVCEFNRTTGYCLIIIARFYYLENAEQYRNELMSEFADEDKPFINIVDIKEV